MDLIRYKSDGDVKEGQTEASVLFEVIRLRPNSASLSPETSDGDLTIPEFFS